MSAKCCHRIAIEGVRRVARKVIIATALETRSKLFEWLQAPQHFPILVHPPNSNVKFFGIKLTNNVNGRQYLIKGSGNFVRTHSWCGWHLRDVANRRSQRVSHSSCNKPVWLSFISFWLALWSTQRLNTKCPTNWTSPAGLPQYQVPMLPLKIQTGLRSLGM